MKTVKQKHPADCAVCALAMFLGVDYNRLMELVPCLTEKVGSVQNGGLTKPTMLFIIQAVKGKTPILIQNPCLSDSSSLIMELVKGRPAILSALSLNYEGVGHAMYWDGKKVYDPSTKKKYTAKTIKPYEAIII